jgi:hypothetical protein
MQLIQFFDKIKYDQILIFYFMYLGLNLTQLALILMRRTAIPFLAPAPGGKLESTSRCQTMYSIRALTHY